MPTTSKENPVPVKILTLSTLPSNKTRQFCNLILQEIFGITHPQPIVCNYMGAYYGARDYH